MTINNFCLLILHLCIFLHVFIKSSKARKLIILENTILLLDLQRQFNLEPISLSNLIKRNFCLLKSTLDTEVLTILSSRSQIDLASIDMKIVEVLKYNTLYYDVNILDSVPLSPQFSCLSYKE